LNANLKAYAAWNLWTDLAKVPEPGSIVMLATALCGLLVYACRRRRNSAL